MRLNFALFKRSACQLLIGAQQAPPRPTRRGHLKDLDSKINATPTTSLANLAKDMMVRSKTMGHAIRDLGMMKSRARHSKQILTEASKENQITRCPCSHMAEEPQRQDQDLLRHENVPFNRRNNRFISPSSSEVKPLPRTKHLGDVIMLGSKLASKCYFPRVVEGVNCVFYGRFEVQIRVKSYICCISVYALNHSLSLLSEVMDSCCWARFLIGRCLQAI